MKKSLVAFVLVCWVLVFFCFDAEGLAGTCYDPVLRKNRECFFKRGADGGVETTPDVGSLAIGTPESKSDDEETEERSYQFKNSADETTTGERDSYIVLDNTDGSEDTALVRYRMDDGTEAVAAYFGPPMGAAPSWTPATGCRVISDGTGSGVWATVQGLFWDGDSWEAD